MTDKHAVMICGHGSRDNYAIEEFNSLAFHLKNRLPDVDIESGFLEFAKPVIRAGLEKLKERGAKKIVCLPGMLFAAGHVKNDLPSEINNFSAENPSIEMVFGRELAIDSKLLAAARDRIEEAERRAYNSVSRKETLLMVVGRGTNDPDANSNVSKVARMLWEGMGFGWAEVSYSGVAFPLVKEGLQRALRLGYKRIIVFPYFLFTGILVRRIYTWADEVLAANSDVEIVKASYLNDHAQLIDCFIDRLEEALNGSNNMNCLLCKYREQIIGYERDHGAAQIGHHHHVIGIGTDGHGASDHGPHHHGHNHDHDHLRQHGDDRKKD